MKPLKPDTDTGWIELFQQASAHHRASRLVAAEEGYLRVLEKRPNAPDVARLLGLLYREQGNGERARQWLEKAVQNDPHDAEAFLALGSVSIELAHYGPGLAFLRKAIELRSDYPEAHFELAKFCHAAGKIDQAAGGYQRALSFRPDYSEALFNLGALREDEGRLQEAADCFRRVTELKPANNLAHVKLGILLEGAGDLEAAERYMREGIGICPEDAQGYLLLGMILIRKDRLSEAVLSFNRAVQLEPNLEQSVNATLQGILEDGAKQWETKLQKNSDDVSALAGLARIRYSERKPMEAIALCRRALAVCPSDANVLCALAFCELMLGEYESGWRNYESRFDTGQREFCKRHFAQPRWSGESAAGRTILIYAEQGAGDTIQFVRYAPMVRERCARVVVECAPGLKRLVQTVAGIDQVVSPGDPVPEFDFQIPLMSLPLVFRTTLAAIPSRVPYLLSPPGFGSSLPGGSENRKKVGIVWAGNPDLQNDLVRSMPLSTLLPVASISDIQLYSLQVGLARNQLRSAGQASNIIDLGDILTDFSRTAAVIEQLDLVIGVDTAVAHLAGALAKPMWLLLPFASEWRWLLDRNDSPWYPTMRLFRQPKPGDWESVVAEVCRTIALRCGGCASPAQMRT